MPGIENDFLIWKFLTELNPMFLATYFDSRRRLIKDSGTAERHIKVNFTEYVKDIIMPIRNVEIDWSITLSGKPMTCFEEKCIFIKLFLTPRVRRLLIAIFNILQLVNSRHLLLISMTAHRLHGPRDHTIHILDASMLQTP